jgi:hypothetical protein
MAKQDAEGMAVALDAHVRYSGRDGKKERVTV